MNKFQSWPRPSNLTITTVGLTLIILLGALDYVTGSQISFSIFYLLPISLVTWFTDRQGGIIAATISAITWLIADLTTHVVYTHPLIPYWNAVVRLVVFLAIVFLESALKNLNKSLEDTVKDRTALLEAEVDERKNVEKRLLQYAKRLEILHEIDQVILAAESLEAVAQSTIYYVRNMLSCDRVSFMLLDFNAHQVVLYDLPGENKDSKPLEKHMPMDKFPEFNAVIELLRQGNIQVNHTRFNSPLESSMIQILHAQDYPSLMIIPILIQNELIGSLNLLAYHSNAFSSEYQEIGSEIANQLGIAINQVRMIDQLRADQENLQALSQRLLEVQEAERRNIARELHDEIGQALTGIRLTLEMTTKLRSETLADSLKQAHTLVVELMERVSQLSLELRPALLDDLGLLPSLLWFLDRYSSQTNINAIFKHSGLENRRFAPEIETAAYRIIQEALTNVARHAGVSETWVTLWYDQDILGIQVEDEGQGFDLDEVLATGNSSGLIGMQERALLLNGKLTIESAQGMGTRLLAELPVSGTSLKET
jgi:signal transduction histidine kinase